MPDPLIGQEIDGFRILDELGRGGMGVVYKAEDVALARTVALKMIARDLASDESFVRRFRAEARALARIDSPHITSIYALRRTDAGLFIAMEYIGGGTLAGRMARGPLPWAEVKSLVTEMIAALEHAHGVGVIHRDIKPGNILLSEAGHVKVTDFGLAKLHETDGGATVTKGIAGTLHYMSPEQVKGERNLDGRSDLYSLGMTIYEVLTGRLPFERGASEFSTMRTIVEEDFPPPERFVKSLPPGVGAAVMKALAKDPDARYPNAAAMRAAFEAIPAGGQAAAPPPDAMATIVEAAPYKPDVSRRDARRPLLIGGGVFGVAALALLTLWLWPSGAAVPLTVVTDPPGALVYVDGVPVGESPVEGYEARGEGARLRVERAGYLPLDTVLTFADGAPLAVRLPLVRREAERSGAHVLRVVSEPAGASVFVNGERVGETPYTRRDTTDAPLAVRVERPGYQPWEQAGVAPNPDAPTELRAVLVPVQESRQETPPQPERPAEPGTLVLTADPGGTVAVAGQRGDGSGTFSLSAGTHTVRCEHPRYGTFETRVRVRAGEREAATCYFQTRVNVQTITDAGPTWGAVWIDGSNSGETTPTVLTLGPGTYRIEVRRDGYAVLDPPRTLTIAAGLEQKTERLVFTLQKE